MHDIDSFTCSLWTLLKQSTTPLYLSAAAIPLCASWRDWHQIEVEKCGNKWKSCQKDIPTFTQGSEVVGRLNNHKSKGHLLRAFSKRWGVKNVRPFLDLLIYWFADVIFCLLQHCPGERRVLVSSDKPQCKRA